MDKVEPINVSLATLEALNAILDQYHHRATRYTLHTSGSTGAPKQWDIRIHQIEASVRATADFFSLDAQSHLLVCLPLNKISGFIMLMRGLLLGAHTYVVEPSGNALDFEFPFPNRVDFASFTPMQVRKMLVEGSEKSIQRFSKIHKVLLGGESLDVQTEKALAGIHPQVWMGYGMTETISHVALRKLSEDTSDCSYTFLPGIDHKVDADHTLWIKGAVTDHIWLHTKDKIRYTGKEKFEYLGRADSVINSGGIKIHPDEVDRTIMHLLQKADVPIEHVCTLGIPHPVYGQCAVTVLGIQELPAEALDEIRVLPLTTKPKYLHFWTQNWPLNSGLKTDVQAILQVLHLSPQLIAV